jgi:hypothetical protein
MVVLALMERPGYLRVVVLRGSVSRRLLHAVSGIELTCNTYRYNEEEACDETNRNAKTQRIWHLDSRIRALLSLNAL